jgi:ribokinase
MNILNFGSLNIDHVYSVDHLVRPGETLGSTRYRVFMGGKGSNQSIALAYAGAQVFHAGKLGRDGVWLKDRLQQSGVNTTLVDITDGPSGHAIIQVNKEGENAIILFGGANRAITPADAVKALSHFIKGDYLLLQNEISATPEILREAARIGLRIFFNPAPMHRDVLDYPLDLVSGFIVNEIEGGELTGETAPARILAAMQRRFPDAMTVLTLGADGVMCTQAGKTVRVPAVPVKAVDTTAAGDTFIGYFLAELLRGSALKAALALACKAAAICVTRPGAADSIPKREEVAG